jgi:SAM-dependent methyltransferase
VGASSNYFDRYYGDRDWRFYRPLLAEVVTHSIPGRISDAGAGIGLFVEAAWRWGLDCVGLEAVAAAVEQAHLRVPELPLQVVNLEDPWPVAEGSAGTVVMNQVIEHLDQDIARRVLRQAWCALQPGGALIVKSPGAYNREQVAADPTHLYAYTPTELRGALSEAGFSDVTSRDAPLELLGHSRIGRLAMAALWRCYRPDRLSASANCLAYRPQR